MNITNTGGVLARGVDVTNTLTGPIDSISNITLTNCGGYYSNTSSGSTLSFPNVSVGVGQTCSITYDVAVSINAQNGDTITNIADI